MKLVEKKVIKNREKSIIAYHGSKKYFKSFELDKVGSNIGTNNFDVYGIYFSNDKEFAKGYAIGESSSVYTNNAGEEVITTTPASSGYVYTCNITYSNPYIISDKGLNKFESNPNYMRLVDRNALNGYDIVIHKDVIYTDPITDKIVNTNGIEYIVLDPKIIHIIKTEHFDAEGKLLNEALLLEKKRQELLNQSKRADIVKTYGTTRYDAKNRVKVMNTTANFNSIDMNSLFKADLLSFKIPIEGETDTYEVEILFDGILNDIQKEIAYNNDEVEYKCIYKAIISAINRQDIYISCTCQDWKYRMAFWSTKGRFNSGRTQLVPARITNPNNSKGAGCKHVMNVLANLSWALNIASVITNYIKYMKDKYPDKYQKIIYPAIFGRKYEEEIEDINISDEVEEA